MDEFVGQDGALRKHSRKCGLVKAGSSVCRVLQTYDSNQHPLFLLAGLPLPRGCSPPHSNASAHWL